MSKNNSEQNLKVGNFLVSNKIITKNQLDEGLMMQKDNPDRLIGEILVTLGFLTKEDLIMSMEMFFMTTDNQPKHVDEWLDQDEIDMIQERISKNPPKNK